LYFHPVVPFCLFIYLFSSPNLSSRTLDVYHTSTHGVALVRNLECRSEMCSMRLAENTGPKKSTKIAICAPSHNFVGLYLRNQGTYRQSQKALSSIMSSRCPHNMVNIGPLTAEIGWRIWGTPANFNGFRVLAALLRQPNFAALNRGCHLCSAGRPSRWALVHISSTIYNLSVWP